MSDAQDIIEIVRRQALNTLEEIFVEIHHLMLDSRIRCSSRLQGLSAEDRLPPDRLCCYARRSGRSHRFLYRYADGADRGR